MSRTSTFPLGIMLLFVAGCGGDAHVVARVAEHTLTVDELSHMFAQRTALPVTRELVERVTTWWVEYQLVAERFASGDSLLDSTTVLEVMWPRARGYILDRWRGRLFESVLPLDSSAVDSIYRAGSYRLIQHVLIRAEPREVTEVRARKRRKAESLRSRLTRGLAWRAAQVENEDAIARGQGGSIGVIRRGQTAAEMEEAAFALAPGAISRVLESAFGYHIARRPPLAEVREEYRAAVEPLVADDLDSLHALDLRQQRRVALTATGLELTRAAVRDPLRYIDARRVIATFDGGRFTVSDVVRWLRTIPDWQHTELERGDEQQLVAFLHSMMGYELLYLEARAHGVTLTPAEFAELKDDLARRLGDLRTALGVHLSAPGDSASPERRLFQAARRVNAYLSQLTTDWQGFVGVPALLAERLKRSSRWAIYSRRLDRVVERALELQRDRKGRRLTASYGRRRSSPAGAAWAQPS